MTGVRFNGTIHDFAMLNAITNTPATRGAINLACDHLRRFFASKQEIKRGMRNRSRLNFAKAAVMNIEDEPADSSITDPIMDA